MISMTEKYHCSFFHVLRISLPWKRTRCVDWDGGVCFILFGRSEIKVEWRMRDVLCWHGDHEGSVQRYTLGGKGGWVRHSLLLQHASVSSSPVSKRALEYLPEESGVILILPERFQCFCVQIETRLSAEPHIHQTAPCVLLVFFREELYPATQLLRFLVHVVHELVNQRGRDLLHLSFGIRHFPDQDLPRGIDAALGVGVEHFRESDEERLLALYALGKYKYLQEVTRGVYSVYVRDANRAHQKAVSRDRFL